MTTGGETEAGRTLEFANPPPPWSLTLNRVTCSCPCPFKEQFPQTRPLAWLVAPEAKQGGPFSTQDSWCPSSLQAAPGPKSPSRMAAENCNSEDVSSPTGTGLFGDSEPPTL